MSRKSVAFCKIYVANRRSFAEPLKFKIVHILRRDETHVITEIGYFHSLDELLIVHYQRIKNNNYQNIWREKKKNKEINKVLNKPL